MVHIENNHKLSNGDTIKHTQFSSSCTGSLTMKNEYFEREASWIPTYISHDGHDFFLRKVRKNNGCWYNWVCILGSQKIADKFKFIITYTDKDGDDVFMYKGNIISIDVPKDERPRKEGSVFEFHDHMVRNIWVEVDQRISYKLTVQNK